MSRRAVLVTCLTVPLLFAACSGGCSCGGTGTDTDADTEPDPIPPGPMIRLVPDPGSGPDPLLVWQVDADVQLPGPSITDPTDTDNFCKLRGDFIGVGIRDFRFHLSGGGQVNHPAEAIELRGDTLVVSIAPSATKLTWSLRTLHGSVVCASLVPSGEFDTGTLPQEFFGFRQSGLIEAGSGRLGERLDIRLEME